MLARAFLAALLIAVSMFAAFRFAATTNWSRNRRHLATILLNLFLALAAIALTVAFLATIITVERH